MRYWKPESDRSRVIDRKPFILLIKGAERSHRYELKLYYQFKQPGNGFLMGVTDKNKSKVYRAKNIHPESYNAILEELKEINISSVDLWKKILDQKKDGALIKATCLGIREREEERLLNGFGLLLDFEIIRRKFKGDFCIELPIIVCYPIIMKHFKGKSLEDSFNSLVELLSGWEKNREKTVTNIINKAGIPLDNQKEVRKEIRTLLHDFHQENEISQPSQAS